MEGWVPVALVGWLLIAGLMMNEDQDEGEEPAGVGRLKEW
jgi:hypothetical protein